MLPRAASLLAFVVSLPSGAGFLPSGGGGGLARGLDGRPARVVPTRRPILAPLYVFDFFRDRAKEGFEQLENIATKTKEGKLGEALQDASDYTADTNERVFYGLSKSRDQLVMGLDTILGGDLAVQDTLSGLEDVLIAADIGVATVDEIVADLRAVTLEEKLDADDIKSVLRARLIQVLLGGAGEALKAVDVASDESEASGEAGTPSSAAGAAAAAAITSSATLENRQALCFAGGPTDTMASSMTPLAGEGEGEAVQEGRLKLTKPLTVFLVIGANGMGKTTTIGKLAHRLKQEGNQKVVLAACDTFRAAAVEQLEAWSERADVSGFVKPLVADSGDDVSRASGLGGTTTEKPATVLYRALDEAARQEADVLIVDTSGRLANNAALNAELVKMRKVVEKRMGRPPHETLLVVDAAIGRNALEQARIWRDEVGLTGVVVTKLDGTARAGYVVGLVRDLQLPVKLVGVGEKIDDLQDFNPPEFVDALLDLDPSAGRELQQRLGSTLSRQRINRDRAAKAKQKEQQTSGTASTSSSVSSNSGASPMGLSSTELPPLPGEEEEATNSRSGRSGRSGFAASGKKSKKKKKK